MNPAYVQAQETAASDDTIGEIVVTGIRESLKSAQAIKQNAEQMVDSITSQDIGALPDRSVSEALQRIPGVTLQRTNENRDPARLAAEGGGISIRGLTWVRSETNGRDIFSANNGRQLSFEDVSADLLAGVDVYKNPSADMVEGGIGGIVNLRTRLPFDSDKRLMAVSADYNYADLKEQGFISANALYSDRWDTGAGKMGFLVSGSLGNIGNRTDSVQTGRFDPQTTIGGSTVYIPNSIGWREIDWEQKRTAVSAAFQWAPTDALAVTLQGLYGKADPHDIEHALGDVQGGDFTNNPSFVFDSQGALVSGTLPNYNPDADTRFGSAHKTTTDYAVNIKYIPNDHWAFSGDFQYVTSHADILSMTAFTQMGGGAPRTLDFDLSGNTPFLQVNQTPDSSTDPSAYWWAAAMDHLEDNDGNARIGRVDTEFTFDDSPWLKSFRMGVRATDKAAVTRQTGWNWSLLSNQFWGNGGGAVVPLTSTGYDAAHTNAGLPGAAELFSYSNFFRGDVNLPGVGWFPTAATVGHGTANAYDLLRNTESSGWGWAPLSTDFSLAHPAADNVTGGVNDQGEQTKAVYAVLRFAHSSPIGPMDGNIGLRYVKTETSAVGLASTVGTLQGGGTPAGCASTAATVNGDADPTNDLDCTAFNLAYAFAQAGGALPGTNATNNYDDLLPTLNLRFHLRDDLQLRFALGKAMVRPTFSQMVPYSNLGFNFNNTYYPVSSSGFATASGGNPLLHPTRAKQFDTSLEWYFSQTGSLTAAAFYKDVVDYIFLGDSVETFTSGSQSLSFLTSRNKNGSHGKIKGFEIGYQQFYDKLPGFWSGFGVQANFTYVDSTGGKNTAVNILEPAQVTGAADQSLPLEGLSKTSYNLVLMYEKYNLAARVAYNWRERYLLTTSAANIQRPVWFEDYGQVDASAFYSITPKIKVGVEATNILNTRTFLDVGGVQLAPRYSWTDTDRRIALAIRTTF